jgi:hypothetical protein
MVTIEDLLSQAHTPSESSIQVVLSGQLTLGFFLFHNGKFLWQAL